MAPRPYNVLFLCTGNSARSILAECILNRLGKGRFTAYSAGSQPKGTVHPLAIALLERENFATGRLRSKSWDEFATAGAPALDFVFTVCDGAAQEVCPVWPDRALGAHWGIPDPAAVEGRDAERAFEQAYAELSQRIAALVELPIDSLDRPALQARLDRIGAGRD